MDRAWRGVVASLAVLVLGSCGGGGGGDDGGGTPPPQFVLPARPAIFYSGNASPAAYDKTTAAEIAAIAMRAIDYSQFLARDLRSGGGTPGIFDSTVSCPAGGFVRLRGNFTANGTGFQIEDYVSCSAVAGAQYTGRIVVEISQAGSGSSPTVAVLGYHDLAVTQAKYSVVVTGTIATSFTSALPQSISLDLNLLLTSPTGRSTYLNNVSLDADRPDSARYLVDVGGRIYDSQLGYIDWESEDTLEYTTLYGPPNSGGPIAIDANGPPLLVSPRNVRWVALELDEDDDGDHELTRQLAWTDVFSGDLDAGLDQSGPSSNIGGNDIATVGDGIAGATVGNDVELDALASSFPGGSFVSHSWSLAWSPQGASPVFDNTDLPRVNFRPDLPGDYLVVHTATVGGVSVTDRVRVKADTTPRTDLGDRFALGSVRRATVGVALPLTFTGIHTPTQPDYVPSFSFERRPPGSSAVLTAGPTPDSRSLIPDLPGTYVISISASHIGAADIVEVIADHGLSFEAAAATGFTTIASIRDLDGDGLGDLLVDRPGLGFQSIRQIAPGIISGDIQLPAGLTDARTLIDVDGDGLVDILSHISSLNTQWWKRAADGSYALHQTLAPLAPPAGCSSSDEIAAAQDSSDRTVVFVARRCGSNHVVDVYAYDGAVLAPLTTIDFGGHKAGEILAGDLNGDGLVDAALSLEQVPAGAIGSVSAVFATSTSAFGTPFAVFTPLSGNGPGIELGTFTNTGRKSIFHRVATAGAGIAVRMYTWTGSGFAFVDSPAISTNTCMRALDFTGDGLDELVTCPGVYQFNPNGTFLRSLDYYGGQSSVPVTLTREVGDVDGDGVLDIVTSDGMIRFGRR